jgi:hypothetical protein
MADNAVNESSTTSRFCTVDAEPQEILPPIQGYENEPLVSLEDAVKPLVNLVPEVERMAMIVTGYGTTEKDGLSLNESASILLYSLEWEPANQSFCFILNTTLQKANRGLLKPWFLYLRLIISALAKLPSQSIPFKAYRGVKKNLSDQFEIGNQIVWWAFSSCTTSTNVLDNERFLGKNGARTLFIVHCHSGKNIHNHTFYPDEQEVLLLPACQFEVISCVNNGNDFHTVHLKEIQPKYPLINPVAPPKSIQPNASSRLPSPANQHIPPSPKPTPVMSILPKKRLQPLLLTQRPVTALPRQLASPIATSNNLAQFCGTPLNKKAVLPPIVSLRDSVQQSITLTTASTQHLIASSTNSVQRPVTQASKRKQHDVIPKNQPAAKSPKHNVKPPEQREPLHMNPVNIRCYILTNTALKQCMGLSFHSCVFFFIFTYLNRYYFNSLHCLFYYSKPNYLSDENVL